MVAGVENLSLSEEESVSLNALWPWPSTKTTRYMYQGLTLQNLCRISLEHCPPFLAEVSKGAQTFVLFPWLLRAQVRAACWCRDLYALLYPVMRSTTWHIFRMFMEKIQNRDRVEESTLFREKWQRMVPCNAYLYEYAIMANKLSCWLKKNQCQAADPKSISSEVRDIWLTSSLTKEVSVGWLSYGSVF